MALPTHQQDGNSPFLRTGVKFAGDSAPILHAPPTEDIPGVSANPPVTPTHLSTMSPFMLMENDSFPPVTDPSEFAVGFWIEPQDQKEFQEDAMSHRYSLGFPLGIRLVNPQLHGGHQLQVQTPWKVSLRYQPPRKGTTRDPAGCSRTISPTTILGTPSPLPLTSTT